MNHTRLLEFSSMIQNVKTARLLKFLGIHRDHGYTLNLPSGHSCPFASDCLSKAARVTGKITDGKDTLFRCFSATSEARSTRARDQGWRNFEKLRRLDYEQMVQLINESLPENAEIVRPHVRGDFFNHRYYEAWLQVARLRPNVLFYIYTKSLPYVIANLDKTPENFIVNASRGGRYDDLIDEYNLKVAEVVYSPEEAEAKGLPIDHDETHAITKTGSFALLLHGTQPAGSDASKALSKMNREGVEFAYSRKREVVLV